MLQTIITWFAKLFLEMALKEAVSRAEAAGKQLKLDAERGKINEENAQAYRESQTREERIRRAVDLINGTKS